MSDFARLLEAEIPRLRRYARAVTGSQERGDEWVRLCAEVAVRQPELVANAEDTKLGIFALFHRRFRFCQSSSVR